MKLVDIFQQIFTIRWILIMHISEFFMRYYTIHDKSLIALVFRAIWKMILIIYILISIQDHME